MAPARLATIDLPDFGMPGARPEISATRYAERTAALRERAEARGYDRVVVYADREHSANLAFLTGFDPRFEEAMLVLGPDDPPALLVGNECHGMAGAAPLPMRRHLFQDFSLPAQPRDRSRPLAEILADEGILRGRRVGVIGWKTFADRARLEIPAYIADELRTLAGRDGPGRERERPPDRCPGRAAGHQRRRPACGVRACRLPHLGWGATPARRAAAGDDRARGCPASRLERHAALLPPDAVRRAARVAWTAEPRRAADRAR